MWFRKHHSGDQCNLTHSNLDLIHLPLEWQMHYAPGEEKDFSEINLELDGLINVAFGTMQMVMENLERKDYVGTDFY